MVYKRTSAAAPVLPLILILCERSEERSRQQVRELRRAAAVCVGVGLNGSNRAGVLAAAASARSCSALAAIVRSDAARRLQLSPIQPAGSEASEHGALLNPGKKERERESERGRESEGERERGEEERQIMASE
ncbi:hypothetical protein AOLI_G00300440 [Acnodon oligacanthus]